MVEFIKSWGSYMLDLLQGILDFFVTIINFIVTMISGIVQFFAMLPGVINFMTKSVAYLPAFLAPFFVLGISVLIVKVIIDTL